MLYRKYRPTTFAEIEGQEHIVQTLNGAISNGRISHAYFFSGPRGTGKTTMALLLAKAINCTTRKGSEPCNKCHSCTEINAGKSLDLIEIDAASNRGIDEIRNLKESAGVSASSSTHKIFIIDEVHMLTTPAFNALLKTLEEPPSHTIFILATTEPHKVPATILSRVQRFEFKKITDEQIIGKLKKIAKAEKVTIDGEALKLICAYACGSMRDAESALAKLMSYAGNTISEEQTSIILGVIPEHIHLELLEHITLKKADAALAQIDKLYQDGINLEHLVKQFIEFTRTQLIETIQASTPSKISAQDLVKIIEAFIEARTKLKSSPIPQLPLELAVIDLTSHA